MFGKMMNDDECPKFVKLSDVKEMLESGGDISGLKVYQSRYKAYMPIEITDYGYADKPVKFECGSDKHHFLEVTPYGSLRFVNMQNGIQSYPDYLAKEIRSCSFNSTFDVSEEGEDVHYITPQKILVIDENEQEKVSEKPSSQLTIGDIRKALGDYPAIRIFLNGRDDSQVIEKRDIILRSDYVATKLWSRDDIEAELKIMGYEGNNEQVEDAINRCALEAILGDCSDDWDKIYDALCSIGYSDRRQQ